MSLDTICPKCFNRPLHVDFCFSQATLPLGGIRPEDARTSLEQERQKADGEFPPTFALELAYIREHYGDETESEADDVLALVSVVKSLGTLCSSRSFPDCVVLLGNFQYMKGAKSMVLAVSYAQRTISHSNVLWNTLIDYCLTHESGRLFGSLLEAAALSGADLANLVAKVPHGMAIEGLRPRLVAAVTDYRLKLKMHETASQGARQEMISILQELGHRSRRGTRYMFSIAGQPKSSGLGTEEGRSKETSEREMTLSTLRPTQRRDRHNHCLPPIVR